MGTPRPISHPLYMDVLHLQNFLRHEVKICIIIVEIRKIKQYHSHVSLVTNPADARYHRSTIKIQRFTSSEYNFEFVQLKENLDEHKQRCLDISTWCFVMVKIFKTAVDLLEFYNKMPCYAAAVQLLLTLAGKANNSFN